MAQRYALQDIRLRALGKEDLPLLMSWENAPEALRSNDSLNPLSEDFIARYISSSTRHILETGSLGLMIEETATNTPLGHLSLYDYSPIHRRVALGIYVAPEVRQQGIASIALRQAIRYAFTQLRCEQVYAEVLADNQTTQDMLLRLGFRQTALLPSWHWAGDSYQDLLFFQLWSK